MLRMEIGAAQRVLNCLVRDEPMSEESEGDTPREVKEVTTRLMK